jgi:tRNA nucleotidyltransferase/poly(A) polymerase
VGYALIFHDLGKPRTFFFDKEKGVVHFFGHEKISMEISEKIMERLRFSHNQKRVILELIRHHMWIFLLCKDTPTLRATKRLILKMGDLTPSLILLTLCDMFGTTQGKRNETTDRVLEYSKELIKMYRDFMIEPPPKIIDGYDLISLGYEEGPFLGQVLREIREKQVTGEITDREQAIEYARERLRFQ